MTFAPIHDFLPRKFPSVYPDPLKNWSNLPAFVADRQTDQFNTANNPWLTSMYSGSSLPFGEIPTT
jgi:hypothetical protein